MVLNVSLRVLKPGPSSLTQILTYVVYFLLIYCMYECFTCMYVCTPNAYMMPTKFRRGNLMPWNWSYRCSKPTCRCWELNPGPLDEQLVLLTSEPSAPA